MMGSDGDVPEQTQEQLDEAAEGEGAEKKEKKPEGKK